MDQARSRSMDLWFGHAGAPGCSAARSCSPRLLARRSGREGHRVERRAGSHTRPRDTASGLIRWQCLMAPGGLRRLG